jgi:lipopolysaccharide export system permease protein
VTTVGRTLSFYLARRVAVTIGLTLLATLAIVFVTDFVEMLRRAGDTKGYGVLSVALLSMERPPAITERALPFAVLLATILAFVLLARRMELVVARATGVSVWQILTPALIVAALVGVAATTVYNPVSSYLRDRAAVGEAALFGEPGIRDRSNRRYIRQRSSVGQSILRAETASERGQVLNGVTAFLFSPQGAFKARIDARRAVLHHGYWQLSDARVLPVGGKPAAQSSYRLPTNLTPAQVSETLAPVQAISFWDLPSVIRLWEKAGLPATRFQLQFQSLLAAPAMLVAMVLIAATVSLGFFRLGGIARVIIGGVVAGFVLYVVTKLSEDLGAAGFVPPVAAAWAPAIVGALVSVTVLLHQEDG